VNVEKLTLFWLNVSSFPVKSTDSVVTISQLSANTSRCVKRAEAEGAVQVVRHGKTVALLMSTNLFDSILESQELWQNPAVRDAVTKHNAGALKLRPLR
jgi:prevent-host-death family protein